MTIEQLLVRFVGQSLAKLRACSVALEDRPTEVDWDLRLLRVGNVGDLAVEPLASWTLAGDDFRWEEPRATRLRDFADTHAIPALARPAEYTGEISPYEFAFVACGILNAPGLLVFKRENRAVFVVLPEVEALHPPVRDGGFIAETIVELIDSIEPPEPRAYIEGLLETEGWSPRTNGTETVGVRDGERIVCTFDASDRIGRVEVERF